MDTHLGKPDGVSLIEQSSAIADHAEALSFFDLFMQADMVVKAVMLLLLFASVWSWSVIIEKNLEFFRAKRAMRAFEREFWSGKSLEALFKGVISNRDSNPLSQILIAAMQELNATEGINIMPIRNKELIYVRINSAMQVACSKVLAEKEEHIGFLVTASSISPFIGLFGTVWGIMNSFQSIAASKNTTLAVVAPGIAEALLATACGFVVAIPASIFYNKFAQEISKLGTKVENFSIELGNIILRDLDKH